MINTNQKCVLKLTAVLIGSIISLQCAQAEPLIYTTLEPKEITIGESAQLTITNLGADSRDPTLPVVAGLQFEIIAHNRQFELTNGATLRSSSIVVRVTPQLAGTFVIPRITASSQPLTLNVNANHGDKGSTGPGNTNYMIRPPVQAIAPKNGSLLSNDSPAFVRLSLPKRDVYVGESVPVDIQVGVRAGVVSSLNGLPTLRGGEFTLNNLSHQPDREERNVDDKHITLLTWHSVLAAIKPGVFAIGVETPLTIKVSLRPKQDSAIDTLLGDPFLQNYFGATASKQITVPSPTMYLRVLPIPREGRPTNFGGAVGSFMIATEMAPVTGAAGDPLTLRMRVSGTGNFDRVNTELFKHLDEWKTYPAKSSFHASDTVGFRGEKVFEQPLIAPRPGTYTVPTMTFSYFDPIARRFETASSPPITVDISSALSRAAPAASASSKSSFELRARLRPDHLATASFETSLVPLYLRPQFLTVPAITTALFVGGWFGSRHRAPRVKRRKNIKNLKRNLAQLDAAAADGDTVRFFRTARAILQELLASRWQLTRAQVTTGEIQLRLGTDTAEIRRLFLLADEVSYGIQERLEVDFPHWIQIVHRQIDNEALR